MNAWNRALTTLLAAAAAGFLLWLAAQFDMHEHRRLLGRARNRGGLRRLRCSASRSYAGRAATRGRCSCSASCR